MGLDYSTRTCIEGALWLATLVPISYLRSHNSKVRYLTLIPDLSFLFRLHKSRLLSLTVT